MNLALNSIPEITLPEKCWLSTDRFKEMDYYAVESFHLPIELMMENAGLHLARLITAHARFSDTIVIGVGNGNNGGGGLVAARRLQAWGYRVCLDIPVIINKELPLKQLQRAKAFGVRESLFEHPDIWVDAYLGFSMRPPLQGAILDRINKANRSSAFKIALDFPTGYFDENSNPFFEADQILFLAAAKQALYNFQAEMYLTDLGIPSEVYTHFDSDQPPFYQSPLLKIKQ